MTQALTPYTQRIITQSIEVLSEMAGEGALVMPPPRITGIFKEMRFGILAHEAFEVPPHLCAHIDALPFAENSWPQVVLPFRLETYSERVKIVLEEVFRIVQPGGALYICGLNAWRPSAKQVLAEVCPEMKCEPFELSHLRGIISSIEGARVNMSYHIHPYDVLLLKRFLPILAVIYVIRIQKEPFGMMPERPVWRPSIDLDISVPASPYLQK